MEDLKNTVSEFLSRISTPPCNNDENRRTCSADVLMKTGGPLRMVMKIGTSFFRKGP